MRPILNSPRILRTGNPLTLEGIRQVCPSVFATQPHESRGPRYRYVPTSEPVQHLMNNGWGIYEASQARSKDADRAAANKHMLRMRKLEDFKPAVVGDGVAEVILINSHDGTSAYHLKAGFFRFVCSNGLMVGNQIAGFTVRHTVGPQTSQEVLEAGERVVTESFPLMLDNIDRFKTINMNQEYQYRLAEKALHLRYGSAVLAPITAQELLQCRRDEDKEPSMWNVLNRVQENTIYGGWETRSAMFNRRSQVRPVERVSAVTAINVGIWDEASIIAKEICNAD